MGVSDNLKSILTHINQVSQKCGREGKVKLLAVSKFHPLEKVEEAVLSGQKLFGENRVQEAFEKFSVLKEKYPDIKLHIIGHLQTNKVSKALSVCDCIESVDSIKLIKEINKCCEKTGRTVDILLEYHTGEESKTGFLSENEVFEALSFIKENCPSVLPRGFMTMAPNTSNLEEIRNSFKTLCALQEKARSSFPHFELSELSMGMSGDFETAIEEGSTMVRIGTAIFGEREY
ncbi:MAG: YggS family pyridoxal phosphate-dependent enzyme [Treponema sp.]|nr:YggS family pyridoxal phosphate-dependent enzyme [Treponema sp.]